LKKFRKTKKLKSLKVIISGGGTGGHIYPAISIANALKEIQPDVQILFVGALGRIEMEKVPAAGYEIIGLDIKGFNRSFSLENILFPWKVLKSLWKAGSILRKFKPDVAIGVGGYASGPLLFMAGLKNIPYIIQEQNSYAGVTNKLLSKKASKICVAYDDMQRYFPAEKILITGNPVRSNLINVSDLRAKALQEYDFDVNTKTIFVTGGSLGARTLNESILKNLDLIEHSKIQLIWQTGKFYYSTIVENGQNHFPKGVRIFEFISNMDMAYAAADVIISRAGAGTISELCLLKKAVILVPSPNVAEDHQTKNAKALLKHNAALMVRDDEAREKLIPMAIELLKDDKKQQELANAIYSLGRPNAANEIAMEVMKLNK
jgi:UDP-N-acetylglucosamine--N-acetylmuramyl-(pentapeptide) pyrophosphoryl-undecaprenol N-acetylglucosamine transferase